MNQPSFTPQFINPIPVYFWRGTWPSLLDLTVHETGWLTALILTREGDCCLFPLTWFYHEPPLDDDRIPIHWPHHTHTLHQKLFELTLNDLKADGWQVTGRLEANFIGQQTDPDFWTNIQAHLWQPPK